METKEEQRAKRDADAAKLQALEDARTAKLARIARAKAVQDLAERLACSPAVIPALEASGAGIAGTVSTILFILADSIIAEGERRMAIIAAEPTVPAEPT